MKVISILNFKGGVGKTTTAVNFAQIIAEKHNKKVLLIDADRQANATMYVSNRKEHSLADVLNDEVEIHEAIYKTKYENMDIITGSMDLYDTDKKLKETNEIMKAVVLINKISDIRDYDYVFIDLPPGINNILLNCLIATHEVIIPIRLDYFSISGMSELKKQIDNISQVNEYLKINGVLITHFKNNEFNRASKNVIETMVEGVPVYENVIRYNPKIAESTIENVAINDYSCRCGAAIDYKRAVKEFLERD